MIKFRSIPLAIMVLAITIGVLLPNTVLADLRATFDWFEQALAILYSLWPAIDVVHLCLFLLLGMFAKIAFPGSSIWRIGFLIFCFAGMTELVQIWVPGREARWSDFGLDVAGASISLLLTTGLFSIGRFIKSSGADSMEII